MSARAIRLGALLLGLAACRHPAQLGGRPTPAPRTSTLIQLANADLAAGEHRRARARALAAIERDPNDVDAHAVLGAALWRAGEVDASTAAYRRGVARDPIHFGAVLGLARNLRAAGDHDGALVVLAPLVADDASQIEPRLGRLWSHWAVGDFDAAAQEIAAIGVRISADDPLRPLLDHIAAVARPLVGSGPYFVIDGRVGSTDAELDPRLGLKRARVTIAGARHQAVLTEARDECWIDPDLADALGLPTVGTITPIGTTQPTRIVVVPEVAIGAITIRRIPAIVQPPAEHAAGARTPELILGRQALGAMGSWAFDFPAQRLVASAAAPSRAPVGAVELPLWLPSAHVLHFPAVPIRVGDGPTVLVYLGGVLDADVALVAEAVGHGAAAGPPSSGATVRLDPLHLGARSVHGLGAYVLPNDPPDAGLALVLDHTGLALAGYLDVALLRRWQVTYALGSGRVYIGG